MPDWIYNEIKLSHASNSKMDALEKFLEEGEEGLFDFLRPVEREQRWEAWGTSWEADVENWERDGDIIVVEFKSAWDEPRSLYDYLKGEGWDVKVVWTQAE